MEICYTCGRDLKGYNYGFGVTNQCQKCHIETNLKKMDTYSDLIDASNDQCNHYDTSLSSDGYEVCNDCGAYLKEL